MSITLTANYQEVLKSETVELIEDLLDDHDLEDLLKFIDEHSEDDFVSYFEEYVRCCDAIGQDAVDALIEEDGIDYIDDCDSRYRGCYESTADFAEEYYTGLYDIPGDIVVDWEATWETNLRHSHTDCESGYRNVYIFTDY